MSDSGLPDLRVERAAWSAKKRAHDIYFAGLKDAGLFLGRKLFEETFILPWRARSRLHIPSYWGSLKRKFEKILQKAQPDMIHAHNIFSAKLASEFNVPFVFDDHEFFGKGAIARADTKSLTLREKLLFEYGAKLWSKWEKEIASHTPVITVSETIASEYKKYNARVFVVPNMPAAIEVSRMPKVSSSLLASSLSTVYVGNEAIRSAYVFRDILGTVRIFEQHDVGNLTIIGDNELSSNPPIYSTGFLPHNQMIHELKRHHIGIIPWKRHWFHKYCNPNKGYDYAHAGLLIVSIGDLTPVINTLGRFCKTFNDYQELIEILSYYRNNVQELASKRTEIQTYAQRNLIWEKHENEIFKAYKQALSNH